MDDIEIHTSEGSTENANENEIEQFIYCEKKDQEI
jgi:hypothetical protein